MGVQEQTKQLVRISECPLSLFVKNEGNPNKMKPREFDLLCDNMMKTGWTDPALVVPVDRDAMAAAVKFAKGNEADLVSRMLANDIKMRLVGGHHRFEAASYLGMQDGPVTVIMDPNFDQDAETFQVVRMNVIRGRLDSGALIDMISKLQGQYADEVMQDAFGFADEADFRKLVSQMAKSLPDKLTQDKFKVAAAEIKTIDGLAKLLNHMFSTYGDTLPHGYMVFDYGGQRSIWIQTELKTIKALELVGQYCVEKKRTMDDVLGSIMQLIAKEGIGDFMEAVMAELPETDMPSDLAILPTKDNLAKLSEAV